MKRYFVFLIVFFPLFFLDCNPEDTDDLPVALFSCDDFIDPGYPYQLVDKSQNGPTEWEWTITPDYFSFEENTDEHSQNPVIRFQFAGDYDVSLKVGNEAGTDVFTKTACLHVSPYTIQWNPLPDMPVARGWLDAAVLDGKIYLVGGTLTEGTGMDVYDPLAQKWLTYGGPGGAYERFGHRTIVMEKDLVQLGGFPGPELKASGQAGALSSIESFQPVGNDSWEVVPTQLPQPIGCFCVTATQDAVYVAGGSSTLPFGTAEHSTTLQKYDLQGDVWEELSEMLPIQTYAASAVVDEKWYIAGGEIPGNSHAGQTEIRVLDLATEKWELPPAGLALKNACFGPGSCVLDGKIFCIGGQAANSAIRSIQVIDPRGNTVELATQLPYAAVGPAVCQVEGKLYVFGGSAPVGGAPEILLYPNAYEGILTVFEQYPE